MHADADDLHGRPQPLADGRRTGDQPAAAYRYHHGIQAWPLLQAPERPGSGTGYDGRAAAAGEGAPPRLAVRPGHTR